MIRWVARFKLDSTSTSFCIGSKNLLNQLSLIAVLVASDVSSHLTHPRGCVFIWLTCSNSGIFSRHTTAYKRLRDGQNHACTCIHMHIRCWREQSPDRFIKVRDMSQPRHGTRDNVRWHNRRESRIYACELLRIGTKELVFYDAPRLLAHWDLQPMLHVVTQ